MQDIKKLQDEIINLKKKKNAALLVHNYQIEEIQEIADYLGDSLDLSIKAKEIDSNLIVFCGVSFMAETAKILSPQKKVLHPNPDATCPMADMVTPEMVQTARMKYPNAKVVCYVNTNADVKAECDVCCTSANALKVVENIESEEILFFPDKNLSSYIQKNTHKKIILPEGFCYVHMKMSQTDALKSKELHPNAILVAHPECPPEVIDVSDKVLSTSGMLKFAKESEYKEFIIGTEEGLIKRLIRENPNKKFYSLGPVQTCFNMKKITLNDVYNSLLNETYEVILPENLMNKARKSLEEMIKYI